MVKHLGLGFGLGHDLRLCELEPHIKFCAQSLLGILSPSFSASPLHTCAHTLPRTRTRTHTFTCVHTHPCTRTHTCTHPYTRTHTCTRAHTHTLNTSEKGCRPSLSNTNALTREDLIPRRDFMTPYGVALLSGSNPSSRAREGLSGVLTQGTEQLGGQATWKGEASLPRGGSKLITEQQGCNVFSPSVDRAKDRGGLGDPPPSLPEEEMEGQDKWSISEQPPGRSVGGGRRGGKNDPAWTRPGTRDVQSG